MSTTKVEKLLIHGIRSFGPFDGQHALIEFNCPLTVIVGQNGAGKTTIIECLKYATTGEIPPMSKGGAFVHDPKLAKESEVKARVKLQFRDRAGNKTVVSRILQAVQKPSKIETKTLDSSMEKIIDGQRVQITSRCADVDEEMMYHLGVNKAVLTNVLLCHQEDSTWPLSEGKMLKKKFDQIFEASKYSQALDNIKEIVQEENQEMKECKIEMNYLADLKRKSDEYHQDLKQTEEKIDLQKKDLRRLDTELKPVEDKLCELDQMFDEVNEIEKSIAALDSRKDQVLQDVRELRPRISNPFNGTLEELQQLRANHNAKLATEHGQLEEMNECLRKVSAERTVLDNAIQRLYDEQGRLLAEAENHKNQKANRDRQISTLANQLHIQGFSSELFDDSTVSRFLHEVETRLSRMNQAFEEEKEAFSREENEIQQKINGLNKELTSFEQGLNVKTRQKEENIERVREMERELAKISTSSATLTNLDDDLETVEAELADHRDSIDIVKMEGNLGHLQLEKGRVDESVRGLQEEMAKVTKQASARGVIDTLKKQRRTTAEELKTKQTEIEVDLMDIFDCIPPTVELPHRMRDLERSKTTELEKADEKLKESRNRLSAAEARKNMTEEDLKNKVSLKKKLESEIRTVCGSEPLEYVQKKTEEEIKKIQEDIAGTRGSEPFFKMCVDKVKLNKKCPVCTRGFQSQTDTDKCLENLTQRMSKAIPRVLADLQNKLHSLQEKQKVLQGLAPNKKEIKALADCKIPELENSLLQLNSGMTQLRSEVSMQGQLRAQTSQSLSKLHRLLPVVNMLSSLESKLEELDQKIRSEEGRIPSSARGATRSHHIVERELQDSQSRSDEINRKIDRLRREIDQSKEQRSDLEQQVYRLREKKLEYQEQVNKRDQFVEQKSLLVARNETITREVKELSKQIKPLNEKINESQKQKDSLLKDKEKAYSTTMSEISEVSGHHRRIKEMHGDVKRYVLSGREKEAEDCRRRMEETRAELDELNKQKAELEEQQSKFQENLSTAKVRLREIEDNCQFLKKQADAKMLQDEIESKKAELQSRGFENYESQYHLLQKKREELSKRKGQAEGHCSGLELQTVRLKRELNEKRLKDAPKNYTHKKIDIDTIKLGLSDAQKFYKALDRAIVKFHAAKMEEINEYIRELWVKIYKGNDIDFIEVKSEDDDEESKVSKRKVYNYKIVMVKGSIKLDMRGRCSAGQKMLASIVIRMALAETFSYECGVLALDEPTTNLDDDNKEGLAQALAYLVKERSTMKNFQLIVITHDDAFVEMLGRSQFVDDYYKVTKDRDGISTVRKLSFSSNEL